MCVALSNFCVLEIAFFLFSKRPGTLYKKFLLAWGYFASGEMVRTPRAETVSKALFDSPLSSQLSSAL